MNSRRSNIEVVADILRMGQASKTQIMYRGGMSYAQLNKYLDYLVERGFLLWSSDKYPGGVYNVSERGGELLESIEKIEEMLGFAGAAGLMDNISESIKTPLHRGNRVMAASR
jgi:predicted transcriptional regulator